MRFAGLNATVASCSDNKSTRPWIQHTAQTIQGKRQQAGSLPALQPLPPPRIPQHLGVTLHQFLGHPQTGKKAAGGSYTWAEFVGTELSPVCVAGVGFLFHVGHPPVQPPGFARVRAASDPLPGGCSVSAAATQGLPLSNPALCTSKDNVIFLQGSPLHSHPKQIRHVTEEHVSEVHTPGQLPTEGGGEGIVSKLDCV